MAYKNFLQPLNIYKYFSTKWVFLLQKTACKNIDFLKLTLTIVLT